MTISDRYPFPDSAMVSLAIRALQGDKRHQYTMKCLEERDKEAHDRIMQWAREELAKEDND